MSTGHTVEQPRFHWIPRLIKAHALVDGGTRLALRQETALLGAQAGCDTPCGGSPSRGVTCNEGTGGRTLGGVVGRPTGCHQRNVSVTAVELAGAIWHLDRHAPDTVREAALERLARPSIPGADSAGCPFTQQGNCLVGPMRFMACRQLFVAGSSCASAPDAGFPRRAGLLTPLRQFTLRAFSLLLPFYGIAGTLHDPLYLEALLREFSAPVSTWSVIDPAALLLDVQHARLRPRTLAA